uniref:Uncharacterized protein n=1 Tax=Rangifer tarandus platyrhynchus TaxID=3082113 RepID=A0ACB0E8X0_RANTA|nr:unnamed protein product [Rangifer tarandus platyrhynchus]
MTPGPPAAAGKADQRQRTELLGLKAADLLALDTAPGLTEEMVQGPWEDWVQGQAVTQGVKGYGRAAEEREHETGHRFTAHVPLGICAADSQWTLPH